MKKSERAIEMRERERHGETDGAYWVEQTQAGLMLEAKWDPNKKRQGIAVFA